MPKKKRKHKFSYPQNYSFWLSTIENEGQIAQFLERGDERQKQCIKEALEYLQGNDPEKFEQVRGNVILKMLKEKK